jgi:V/A-type H+/Na+-transporting ATPase subunit E
MTNTHEVSSGVQALIARLKDDGVEAGQKKAAELIQKATEQAAQIVAEARAEAEEIIKKGRTDIEVERTASQEAFKVAIRDTRLKLGEELKAEFASQVRRLVSAELQDRDFLRQILLTIAGRATAGVPEDQPLEVLVCQEVFANGEACKGVTETSKEALRHFVLGVSGEMLREGVELKPSGDIQAGFRIRLVGEDVEIDLTDKALSDLILKHLLPRYRNIVAGVD